MTGRAFEIRAWTTPRRPIPLGVLARYAAVAARWEKQRWRIAGGAPVPADDERFAALSVLLRDLSAELGLRTCTAEDEGEQGVTGITDRDGFLPGDPARLISESWQQSAAINFEGAVK